MLAAALMLCVCPLNISAVSNVPELSAASSILVHADTGTVLYEHDADERMLIASTTKIMTALVVLENAELDDEVEVAYESTLVEGSSMYLKSGGRYTVRELLYGLMLCSGNDAADALARYISGDIDSFAELMNNKASELGMADSCFKNPHGLDAEGHYSTARDLAKLMCAAAEVPEFVAIASARSYSLNGLTYVNHNKLLWQYKGMLCGKTGYTMAAGRILVTCAERDGMRLVCVTISDPDDWNDHVAMYDWAFENYSCDAVTPPEQLLRVHVISGESAYAYIEAEAGPGVFRAKDSELELRYELPRFVYAGVSRGECAGYVSVYVDGELSARRMLIYSEDVQRAENIKLSAWERFKLGWYRANQYGYNYCPYLFLSLGGK